VNLIPCQVPHEGFDFNKERIRLWQSNSSASRGASRSWIALLVLASAVFSLGFACAVPLAAFRRHCRADAGPPRCFRTCWRGLACQSNRWLCDPSLSDDAEHLRLGAALGCRGVCRDPRRAMGERPSPAKGRGHRGRRLSDAFAIYEGSLFAISLFFGSGISNLRRPLSTDFGDQFRCLRGALPAPPSRRLRGACQGAAATPPDRTRTAGLNRSNFKQSI